MPSMKVDTEFSIVTKKGAKGKAQTITFSTSCRVDLLTALQVPCTAPSPSY